MEEQYDNVVCWVCGGTYPFDCVMVDREHLEGPYICLDCERIRTEQREQRDTLSFD